MEACLDNSRNNHSKKNYTPYHGPKGNTIEPTRFIDIMQDFLDGKQIPYRPEILISLCRKAIEKTGDSDNELIGRVNQCEEAVKRKAIFDLIEKIKKGPKTIHNTNITKVLTMIDEARRKGLDVEDLMEELNIDGDLERDIRISQISKSISYAGEGFGWKLQKDNPQREINIVKIHNSLDTAYKRINMLKSLGFKMPEKLQEKYDELIIRFSNVE